jgi:uncharacterized membrane protein YqjE
VDSRRRADLSGLFLLALLVLSVAAFAVIGLLLLLEITRP